MNIKRKEYMTGRERVLSTLKHMPVDRMAIDLGVHFSTGISAFAYRDLRRYLGLPEKEIEVVDPKQFLARVDTDVLERFNCDCILLHPGFKETRRWNPRYDFNFIIPAAMNPVPTVNNGWFTTNGIPGVGLRMPEGGYFWDGVGYDFFCEDEDEKTNRYAREAERIYKETGYFTLYIGYGAFVGSFDGMCRMLTEPNEYLADNEKYLQYCIRHVSKIIDKCGNYIQGITIGDDLGTQVGPMMNPLLYAEMSLPFVKRFCDFVHSNSDYFIFMHCCGAVKDFLGYFIEAGIDAFNPVQVSATGMDPKKLKKSFGDKLTFWGGGCDTQRVLNIGSPQNVKDNVRQLCSAFAKDSGFVFNQVHNIMGDIKMENIVAMLDTAYEESFSYGVDKS